MRFLFGEAGWLNAKFGGVLSANREYGGQHVFDVDRRAEGHERAGLAMEPAASEGTPRPSRVSTSIYRLGDEMLEGRSGAA
ncbi:MAG: hypothetical protein WCD11_19605 [Solirubrobacteraceae bacterium]